MVTLLEEISEVADVAEWVGTATILLVTLLPSRSARDRAIPKAIARGYGSNDAADEKEGNDRIAPSEPAVD